MEKSLLSILWKCLKLITVLCGHLRSGSLGLLHGYKAAQTDVK